MSVTENSWPEDNRSSPPVDFDGVGDEDPDEIQASFEFSGYDDADSTTIERYFEAEDSEEEGREEESELGNPQEPWETN